MPDRGARRGERRALGKAGRFIGETLGTFGLPFFWPYASMRAVTELLLNSTDPVYRGHDIRYGDGKPVVLVPGHLSGDVTLAPLAIWLDAIGYRPVKSEVAINIDDRALDGPLAAAMRDAALPHRTQERPHRLRHGRARRDARRRPGARTCLGYHRDRAAGSFAGGADRRAPPRHRDVAQGRGRVARGHAHRGRFTRLAARESGALKILSEILREIPVNLLDPG